MSKKLQTTSSVLSSPEFCNLFGPSPVLSTEDWIAYERLSLLLMECHEPKDFMEQLLIRQVIDSCWEMKRYINHKGLAIERTFRDQRPSQSKPTELDHAYALQMVMSYHMQLDQALNAAIARRNDALDQLERYRRGAGQRLRKASDEIIDAEFSEAAPQDPRLSAAEKAPSVAPDEG
jgi:hypothetical protein